jgi:hydrogenase maturation protease
VGNPELGDDGVGVLVAEGLREELANGAWRPAGGREVEVVPAGPDSLLAAAHAADGRWVIIVDAARMGLAPGESRMFSPADVKLSLRGDGLSPHAADLAETLGLLDALGCAGRVRVMGIETEDMGTGNGLSPRLSARLPELRARIKEEVGLLP